jgi:N-(5'phosphoribosyl)anthranilate (PRA) isomerase
VLMSTWRPIVQLYCKKLTLASLDDFVAAEPEHIGWQINLAKLNVEDANSYIEECASMRERLSVLGIRSVFLIHPSTDQNDLLRVLRIVKPDIFLASALRSRSALANFAGFGVSAEIMVPIGIPVSTKVSPNYDPVTEVNLYSDCATWYTTDTITESDTPDRFGCSGKTSNWLELVRVVEASSHPVIAAGGLTPSNVSDLWRFCKPAGFDAHSAVCTNGLPDKEKAKAFVVAVRALSAVN